MVVEERARRIVLGMHQVDVGSAWWPMGGGGEDVGVELDESLEALQEQVDEARCHAPLLVIRCRRSDIEGRRPLQQGSRVGGRIASGSPQGGQRRRPWTGR
jgi:hypothetical protein